MDIDWAKRGWENCYFFTVLVPLIIVVVGDAAAAAVDTFCDSFLYRGT